MNDMKLSMYTYIYMYIYIYGSIYNNDDNDSDDCNDGEGDKLIWRIQRNKEMRVSKIAIVLYYYFVC